ncbi:hypothetical protein [Thioclava sp. F36-6]|uniref:hypothetical protein n=1 Tax=Thioclava sp. F36-6 TaxID=1915316 RepID=UPI0009D190C3|nr:hypothetical protein [Thioclava sp. F36-6]OOY32604.1 hypothetical protein BMI88_01565 [Thioclava sp. F36-6]
MSDVDDTGRHRLENAERIAPKDYILSMFVAELDRLSPAFSRVPRVLTLSCGNCSSDAEMAACDWQVTGASFVTLRGLLRKLGFTDMQFERSWRIPSIANTMVAKTQKTGLLCLLP